MGVVNKVSGGSRVVRDSLDLVQCIAWRRDGISKVVMFALWDHVWGMENATNDDTGRTVHCLGSQCPTVGTPAHTSAADSPRARQSASKLVAVSLTGKVMSIPEELGRWRLLKRRGGNG